MPKGGGKWCCAPRPGSAPGGPGQGGGGTVVSKRGVGRSTARRGWRRRRRWQTRGKNAPWSSRGRAPRRAAGRPLQRRQHAAAAAGGEATVGTLAQLRPWRRTGFVADRGDWRPRRGCGGVAMHVRRKARWLTRSQATHFPLASCRQYGITIGHIQAPEMPIGQPPATPSTAPGVAPPSSTGGATPPDGSPPLSLPPTTRRAPPFHSPISCASPHPPSFPPATPSCNSQ